MATLKPARAKKAAAPKKAAPAKSSMKSAAPAEKKEQAPAATSQQPESAGKGEAAPKPAGAVEISPEDQQLIERSKALTSIAVEETGVEISPGISMMPSLRIAASLVPFRKRVTELVAMAERAVIDSPDKYQNGVRYLALVKDTADQLEAYRVSSKRPIDDYSRYIQSLFMPLINELTAKGKQVVSSKMLAFNQAEEEKARKKQEDERAEQQRIANEQAAALAQQGKTEEAQAVVDAAAAAPAPQVQTSVSNMRVDGYRVAIPKTWQGAVVKPMVVLQAILDGKVPINVVDWSQANLNAYARSIKVAGEHNGIQLEEKATLGVR